LFKLISAFIVSIFIILPASAFVPDDGELSSGMQKNYGPLTSWEAEMTFPAHPGVSVHLWYARGKWRQEWKAGDKAVAVGNGGNVVGACTMDGFASSPLFVWMTPNPVGTWKSWGVDSAIRSFGFCGDSPCLSIGADPMDETHPVVHVNNEDFAPLLVRYAGETGLTTVVFSDYKTFGGFNVPEKLTVTVGAQSLDALVKWTAVNRAEGEQLYARDALDATPCAAPPAPFDFLRDSFRYPSVR